MAIANGTASPALGRKSTKPRPAHLASAIKATPPKRAPFITTGTPRIDTIQLFGSQKLRRIGASNGWTLSSEAAKPVVLTKRVCMYINAALHSARRQA